MTKTVFIAVLNACLLAPAGAAGGPFKPDWESLKAHTAPEWFRDAKLGIYTHWGPVTVGCEDAPKGGEWYGMEMYQTNKPIFAYHREKFGDQNKVGYKDMIPKFTAEKFDAEKWADLFAKAGAKFAGPVAVHHDNFALWDSAVTPWNSAKTGPKRDITGELAKAYKARGMKFLPTFHHGFAWRYFEPAFAFDAADGKNVLLYTEPHDPKDPPSERFQEQWLAMVMEVVRKYEPDMIWFDFELYRVITPEYQKRMFADYYNWAAANDRESAVAHKFREIHQYTGILDFERGREDKLVPYPWLTDTSLGPWYNRNADPYRTTENLVHVFVDIVAKNGCMLLNVGPRADGSIPERAEKMLLELGGWLKVNGEAIYATRPWQVYGEGPTRDAKGGGFSERADKKFTAQDVRFTQSKDGSTLYAIALGLPADNRLVVKSLAAPAGRVTAVSLLGRPETLEWRQTDAGLEVVLPAKKPCDYAVSLKITGEKLQAVAQPEPAAPAAAAPVSVASDGSFLLLPEAATLRGAKIRVEEKQGHKYIAAWDHADEWPSWAVRIPEKAAYDLFIECSTTYRDTDFVVEFAGRKLTATAKKTAGWYAYQTLKLGPVEAPKADTFELSVKPADLGAWKAVNIRSITLKKKN